MPGEEAFATLETNEGHFLNGGVNSSYNPSDREMFLRKIDGTNGDTIWNRAYEFTGYQSVTDMDSTYDGGAILAGYSSPGYSDFMLVKVDSTGNREWSQEYGPAGWSYEYADGDTIWTRILPGDYDYDIVQMQDYDYFIVGRINRHYTGVDIHLVRTDENGDAAKPVSTGRGI